MHLLHAASSPPHASILGLMLPVKMMTELLNEANIYKLHLNVSSSKTERLVIKLKSKILQVSFKHRTVRGFRKHF